MIYDMMKKTARYRTDEEKAKTKKILLFIWKLEEE